MLNTNQVCEPLPQQSRTLLQDTVRLEGLMEMHPISVGGYIVATPMIRDCYASVYDRVQDRRTGIVFAGRSRLGKTCTVRYCLNAILKDFPRSAVTALFVPSSSMPRDKRVHHLILAATGHHYSESASPERLIGIIKNHVISTCARLGSNQFILLIDEANNLDVVDYNQLVAIQNSLDSEGVLMTTVLFGLEDLQKRHSDLKSSSANDQISKRFFRKVIPFYGCRGTSELSTILEQYDTESEWPDESGISYTRFFLPQAYENNNLRLAAKVNEIWTILNYRETIDPTGLTMETITLVVKHLLRDNYRDDSPIFYFTKEHITRAIDKADYG